MMPKSSTLPKQRNGAKVEMDVDEEPVKIKKKARFPEPESVSSSVENSASESESNENGGYETGDSADFENGMDMQDDSESDGSSDSNSGDDEHDVMDVDATPASEGDLKIISKAQKLLRASVDEELERIQILPIPNSSTYDDALNESARVKQCLKQLKSTIVSFDACEVVWKSAKSNTSSHASQSPSSKGKSKPNPPQFNATTFMSHYFSDVGGSALVKSLQKEFASNALIPDSSSSNSKSDSENTLFTWQPPTAINVVGSYLLGTAIRRLETKSAPNVPLYTIDLAITLSDDMFKHRDIKGHRYETKRLMYLAVLANHLKSVLPSSNSDSGSDLSGFSHLQWSLDRVEDVSSPHLTLDLTINLADPLEPQKSSHKKRRRAIEVQRHIRVAIRPVIAPTTFKLQQLLPWKPQLVFSGNMPNDHLTNVYREMSASVRSLIPDSPLVVQKASLRMVAQHNQRIVKDALTVHDNRELAFLFSNSPALRSAVTLAMRWLLPRRLTHIFTTHVVSMLFAYLYETNTFKPQMDGLDLFRTWISWLSQDKTSLLAKIERLETETHGSSASSAKNIHTAPPTLAMPKMKKTSSTSASDADWKPAYSAFSEEMLKTAFGECFEAVLISKTGYINVLSNVSAAAWSHLTFEAVLGAQVLEHPDQFAFGTLFKTSLSHSDHAISLHHLPPISTEYDVWLSASPHSLSAPKLSPVRLVNHMNIYHKAEPATTSHKMHSTAMLGGRKAGTQTVTVTSSFTNTETQLIDEAKTKEASEWLMTLSQSSIELNALDSILLQKLISESILFQTLAPRVEYVFNTYHLSNNEADEVLSWGVEDKMPSRIVIHIGLRVQPTQWQKLLEYGPQAQNDDAVSDFIKIWGKGSAGLRKFKDGLILYCVSWGSPPTAPSSGNINNLAASANKHRIVRSVVSHLLQRHISTFDGSSASNDWNIHIMGDDVLYNLLKAPERVDAELVGPTFKTTPAPLTNTDSHDHIGFVWTQLQKVLRSLKGLSMPIKALGMPGSLARYSSCTPPEYNPLSDPEIPFSQRQHAIRAAATASQLCPSSIPCIIQFESSGAWPEDLDAISHVKTALYLELSRHLSEQQASSVSSRASRDELVLFFKGYTFRLCIFHPRELVLRNTLYRQVVLMQRAEQQQKLLREKIDKMEKMKNIEKTGGIQYSSIVPARQSTTLSPELLARQSGPLVGPISTQIDPLQSVLDDFSRFSVSPKLSGLLHSLHLAYPSYGPTCVLVKKWIGAHLLPLSEFADGLLIDLLVARVFHATPYLCAPWSVPPSHSYQAFLRVLYFIAHLAWESGPVMIPLHESHEGSIATTISSKSRHHTAPLGWSIEKIQKIQQRWQRMDVTERPILSICFNDGSSTLEPDQDDRFSEQQPEEVHATSKIPGVATLAYGTPNGPTTHNGWSVDSFVARSTLTRMKKLAQNALKQLETPSEPNDATTVTDKALKFIFEPSLLDFDLVIELKKSCLTRHLSSNLETKKKKSSHHRYIAQSSYLEPPSEYIHQVESIQTTSTVPAPPLLTNFDPVQNFIEQLSERLASRSILFHDAAGGPLVAIVLKPSSFAPTNNITNANLIHALPVTDVRAPSSTAT
jgi:hypothetical protein